MTSAFDSYEIFTTKKKKSNLAVPTQWSILALHVLNMTLREINSLVCGKSLDFCVILQTMLDLSGI